LQLVSVLAAIEEWDRVATPQPEEGVT